MTHRAVQATLDALQVPALLVSVQKGTILALNPAARQQITSDLMPGARYLSVMHEHGWNTPDLAFADVVKGEPFAVKEHRNGRHAIVVASDMDGIPGWPPSVMVTLHTEPILPSRAYDLHRRDRTAVEIGVLLDQARNDLALMNDMFQATWRGIEQATEAWCERIAKVEPTLPHD